MSTSNKTNRTNIIVAATCVATAVLAFIFLCELSQRRKSATFDEGIILASGHRYDTVGATDVNPENPPLLKGLLALPSINAESPPIPKNLPNTYRMGPEFEFGHKFLYQQPSKTLFLHACRSVNIAITAAAAILIFLLAGQFMPKKWAALAASLFLLSPNVIAHARLATVDIGATVLMLAASMCLYLALEKRSWRWGAATGAACAAALCAKYTAVLLAPIFAIQAIIHIFSRKTRAEMKQSLIFTAATAGIVLAATITVTAVLYHDSGFWISLNDLAPRSPLLRKVAGLPLAGAIPLPLPESFLRGFDIVAFNNQPGFPTIFLGRYHHQGGSWWYYYLVVMLVKSPLPTMLMTIAGMIHLGRRWRRSWRLWFWLVPPAVVILNFSLLAHRQLGLRYILPIWPYIAICAAFGIRVLWKSSPRRICRLSAIALPLWLLAATIAAFPDYLSYFNLIGGGQRGGINWLGESNLDWGQDLPGLRRWLDENGDPPIKLLYHGTAAPEHYGIINSPEPEYIAVSASFTTRFADSPDMRRLQAHGPAAIIGGSIYIYPATGNEAKRRTRM